MNKHVSVIIFKSMVVLLAALLMGFGISMYYVSGLGSDPVSTFMEALAGIIGVKSGTMSILANIFIVVIFFFFKRYLINIGTWIQTFCVGLGINMGMAFWTSVWTAEGLGANLVFSITGAVFIGISLAMYIPCDLGTSATDMLVLSICDLIHKSYKWGFYIVYAIAFTLGIMIGGVWGLGTVVALFITGWVADLLMPHSRKLIERIFKKEAMA